MAAGSAGRISGLPGRGPHKRAASHQHAGAQRSRYKQEIRVNAMMMRLNQV